jgi:hypothetical protein
LVAVYLGEVDEEKIMNMSYIFFDDVLSTLSKRVNYDAVVNYAGNSYMPKSGEIIAQHNPFNAHENKSGTAMNSIAGLLAKGGIEIVHSNRTAEEVLSSSQIWTKKLKGE